MPMHGAQAGLICGFRLRAHAVAEPVAFDSSGSLPTTEDGPVWLHFNLVDTRARAWIAENTSLPQVVRELLTGTDHYVRFERAGSGMFAVLGDLHHDLDPTSESLAFLRLYVDAQIIITARQHPLRVTDRVRRDLQEGMRVPTPLHLVAHMLGRLAESFGAVVTKFADVVDETEDRLLVGRLHVEGRELGRVRRFLARLRRHITGTRSLDFESLLEEWAGDAESAAFRRSLERLDSLAQDLDLVQVRARLLQEEIAAQLGEATNRNIYFLSIVTALLLPVTLITGIFGMNVGGLPFLESEDGFFWTTIVMGVTLGATLLVLRWRNLF